MSPTRINREERERRFEGQAEMYAEEVRRLTDALKGIAEAPDPIYGSDREWGAKLREIARRTLYGEKQ